MSPASPETNKVTPIEMGHFIETYSHPETNINVPCLKIYIPDHPTIKSLTSNYPTHFTTKQVVISGFSQAEALTVTVDGSCMTDDSKIFPLGDCASVRLHDANPSTNQPQEKAIYYLVEPLEQKRPMATIQKAKWIDTVIFDQRTTQEVSCSGSVLRIFGRINPIIDPSTLNYRPNLSKHRKHVENIHSRWLDLQIEHAKKTASNRSLTK